MLKWSHLIESRYDASYLKKRFHDSAGFDNCKTLLKISAFWLSLVKYTKIVYLCFLFQPSLPIYVSIKGIVFDVSDSRGKIIFFKS